MPRKPAFQVARFLLGARHALLDAGSFANLRFESAFCALGFEIHFRQLPARFGELRLQRVKNFLRFLPCGVVVGSLYRQVFEFRGCRFERGRSPFGFRFQRHVTPGEHGAELAFQFAFQLLIALGFRGLALERIHLAGDLFEDVEHAREVLLGALQFGLGKTPAALVFRDPGRFFDHRAAVLRLGGKNLADTPLLDDRVAFRTKAAAHENVLDVAQPGLTAINEILAFTRPEQTPRNGDLARLGTRMVNDGMAARGVNFVNLVRFRRDLLSQRVDQHHGYGSHPNRLPRLRSREDHVFHAGAAQTPSRLFTKHPADRIAEVRFAASVRTDHSGDPVAIESQLGTVTKRFKSLEFDFPQLQQTAPQFPRITLPNVTILTAIQIKVKCQAYPIMCFPQDVHNILCTTWRICPQAMATTGVVFQGTPVILL